MNALRFFTAALGASLVCLAACSSGGSSANNSASCSAKGPCPNDPAPTAAQIQQCENFENDPACGAKFTALASCLAANSGACSTAGTSVPSASCSTQESAYTSCVAGELLDGGIQISFDAATGGG